MTPLQKAFTAKVTNKKQYFLQRGKVWNQARKVMSQELAESVVRTWERQTDWRS